MDQTLLGLPYPGASSAARQLAGQTNPLGGTPDVAGRAPGYIPAGYQLEGTTLAPIAGGSMGFGGSADVMPAVPMEGDAGLPRTGGGAQLPGLTGSGGLGVMPPGQLEGASAGVGAVMPQARPDMSRLRSAMLAGRPGGGLGQMPMVGQSGGGWRRGGRMGFGG